MPRSNILLGGQELKLDADGDTSIQVSTDDVISIKTADGERLTIQADGDTQIIGTTSNTMAGGDGQLRIRLAATRSSGVGPFIGFDVPRYTGDANTEDMGAIGFVASDGTNNSRKADFVLHTRDTSRAERMRCTSDGKVLIGATTYDASNKGVYLNGASGKGFFTVSGDAPLAIHRLSDDGDLIELRQANNTEGTISVSGSTVSYNGFSGQHESSGIATNTAVGTVISTIDELDTYASGEKKGQTRADHAKVKVSDTEGDKAVYGVVSRFDADDKVYVASVGIGSVRVTGACAKGDLLESNGDGTAKVQSDDIVRSKTIGKVTIGNSNSGVKLVSCVLYCG